MKIQASAGRRNAGVPMPYDLSKVKKEPSKDECITILSEDEDITCASAEVKEKVEIKDNSDV